MLGHALLEFVMPSDGIFLVILDASGVLIYWDQQSGRFNAGG